MSLREAEPTAMALAARVIRDWRYREAKRRLHRTARVSLPIHTGHVRLDEAGNRVVTCGCGWRGNGLGWVAHVAPRAVG